MHRWIPVLISLAIAVPAAAETMAEHYGAAMRARADGNFEQYHVEIAAADALLPGHPRVDDPTSGVIVDGEFWYIANSHIAGFDHSAPPPDFEV